MIKVGEMDYKFYEELKKNKDIIATIDKDFFFNFVDELYKQIEKQQKEINRLRPYEELEYLEFHKLLKKETELEKKDKIIDLMADQLTTHMHSKEWVIEHFKKEAEQC